LNGSKAPKTSNSRRDILIGLGLNIVASAIWAGLAALWTNVHGHKGFLSYILPWAVAAFLAASLVVLTVLYLRLRRQSRPSPAATQPPAALAPLSRAEIPGVPAVDLQARENELREIASFVGESLPDFLTLWGPGGIGKSALAGAALHEARTRGARVAFVSLAEARDIDDFLVLVARQLGIELPKDQRPADAVLTALSLLSELTVVVLDNLEHIVDEAAPLIDKFAANCSSVRIIVTSRTILHASQERTLAVGPLTYRRTDPGERTDAELLFIKRARRRDPLFPHNQEQGQAVVEICQRVEGLPLGIVLAAGFIGRRSPAEILQGLGTLASTSPGVEERHKSLDAMIDWSIDDLPEETQQFLRQLSVIGGPFDLAAAAAIALLPRGDPLNLLDILVDASLIERVDVGDRSYYRMRAEIRSRCQRYLDIHQDPPVAEVLARCDRFYIGRAETCRSMDDSPDMSSGLDQLEADYEAQLDVMRRNEESNPVTAARIAVCLSWLVACRRPGEERVATLRRIYSHLSRLSETPRELCVKVAVELARAYLDLTAGGKVSDHLATAKEWSDRALELGRGGNDAQLGTALAVSGVVSWDLEERDDARNYFLEAEEVFKRARNWPKAAEAAALSCYTLPHEEHAERLRQAEHMLGDRDIPRVRYRIQTVRLQDLIDAQENIPEAERISEDLTELADRLKVPSLQETALHARTYVLYELGRHEEAAEVSRRLELLYRRRGAKRLVVDALNSQGAVLELRPDATPEQLREALAVLDAAIRLADELEMRPMDTVLIYSNRSFALMMLELPDQAMADSDRIAPLLEPLNERDKINGFVTHVVRARVLDSAGREAEADQAARFAMALAVRYGYSVDSPGPQVSSNMRWLTRYLAENDPPAPA
jgi:predicted ATPase